jgi:hypothetical protein
MTQARKLKKVIRSRAAKTGESYTSARRQVLAARARRAAPAAAPEPKTPTPSAPEPAAKRSRARGVAGEAAVRAKTGHGLDHWFAVLDAFDARAKGHTASARHLFEEHGVPGWHCQMITVEYERARGLRALNQSCEGDFQVGVSRTVPCTVARVAQALGDRRQRAQWLRGADPGLARAVEAAFAGASARGVVMAKPDLAKLRFRWDASTVDIYVYGKPGGKASVTAQNTKLADAEAVAQRRAAWTAALDALRAQLTR